MKTVRATRRWIAQDGFTQDRSRALGPMLCLMLLGASLAGLPGCSSPTGENGRAQRMTGPTTAVVERREVIQVAQFPGTLYVPPAATAQITPPYNAPVDRVLVTVGQEVRKGSEVIRLRMPNVEASYEQARAIVREAETAYKNAEATLRGPVRQAESQLAEARSTERTLRNQLRSGGDASALAEATQARQIAEQSLSQVRAEYESAMTPYTTQLESARRSLRSAQEGKREAGINAPISGTVLEVNVRPGEEVGRRSSEVLATIADLSAFRVRAIVPNEHASLVEDGRPVWIRFRGLPDEVFEGKVRGVRSLPEESGSGIRREATITFTNRGGLVKPGTEVEQVAIETDREKNALAVPSRAIDRDDTGRPFVQVLTDGQWTHRVVELGITDGDFTVIQSGLQEGETVQVPAG